MRIPRCKAGALNADPGSVSSCVKVIAVLATGVLMHEDVHACLWDADTLRTERSRHPKMADVVLGKGAPAPNTPELRKRIRDLRAAPREEDAAWWNNLAGAHIRLGELETAVRLLEPLTNRFASDYGIHANLGTAYHLQGRFAEAEREIARDLEINPEAHFGLEKYHLALLQYLMRDTEYQKRHLYVDEWTEKFWTSSVRGWPFSWPEIGILTKAPDTLPVAAKPISMEVGSPAAASAETTDGYQALRATFDPPPAYRYRWNLADDPKFEEGALYMASLNSRQPACFVMLGIVCLKNHDYNLAAAAYERAIQLGSPQSEPLKTRAEKIRGFMRESRSHSNGAKIVGFIGLGLLFAVVYGFWRMIRWFFENRG